MSTNKKFMSISNFNFNQVSSDPFSELNNNDFGYNVHLHVQQTKGRKCITIVQGLSSELDLKGLTRTWKRSFQCSGSVKKEGSVIQLSGDQRINVRDFLLAEEICEKDNIILHGG